MSDYLAMVATAQPEKSLLNAFNLLQPHGKYKIAFTESPLSDAPEPQIPIVFVQPQAPLFSQITQDRTSLSVNIISPGSAHRDDLAARLIAHPQTTNVSWIGYQTYLTPPEWLAQLQARFFAPLRLGGYRENPAASEPLIRPNNLNLIDLSAIRHSDVPDGLGKEPNGLYAEEICQLARYIGASTHLEACYIYGYPKNLQSAPIITRLLAQILWHLFESLSTCQKEDPYDPNQQNLFTVKEVYIGDHDHVLHFLSSNQTGRWWLRFRNQDGTFHFIPCAYEEYVTALKGELPATWLRYYQKLYIL